VDEAWAPFKVLPVRSHHVPLEICHQYYVIVTNFGTRAIGMTLPLIAAAEGQRQMKMRGVVSHLWWYFSWKMQRLTRMVQV
jgi:hypothetical protein